ncbi:MAG: carbohydrate ABC transporter permease [Candidatus Bathyarchaeia archaeon]
MFLAYLFIVGTIIYTVTPIYRIFSLSIKPVGAWFSTQVELIPKEITFLNYQTLSSTRFPRWVLNSIIVSSSSTGLTVFVTSMAAFAFAFYNFRAKEKIFLLVLSSMFVPGVLSAIPLFIIFAELKLINTYFSIILPGVAGAFGLFFMRGYIRGAVPIEILDSARVDGASEITIFFRIVLPIIKPGIAALAINSFTGSYNDFFWPLIALSKSDMYTVQLGLSIAQGAVAAGGGVSWDILVAGTMVSVLPVLTLFALAQKYFVKGLTMGAVKGAG